MSEETQAHGWDAIDKEMQRLYGDQEPKHYGTLVPYALGGPDPLDGISAYVKNEPIPHWHIVTYGFSELYEKESENKDYSGFGFELTIRLAKTLEEQEPPAWALNFLQNLGRYIFSSGNYFQAGHYLDTNGPIALGSDTLIQSIAFIEDPELPMISTPNGSVEFLQVVGITLDEKDAMQTWNALGLLRAAAPYLPYYITDLGRKSFMEHPPIKEALDKGRREEGSSTGSLFVTQLGWNVQKRWLKGPLYSLTIGAKQAPIIAQVLQGRIPRQKELHLVGQNISVTFAPCDQLGVEETDEDTTIYLNEMAVEELAQLLVPREGVYTLSSWKDMNWRVCRSEITDAEGKVVEVIG